MTNHNSPQGKAVPDSSAFASGADWPASPHTELYEDVPTARPVKRYTAEEEPEAADEHGSAPDAEIESAGRGDRPRVRRRTRKQTPRASKAEYEPMLQPEPEPCPQPEPKPEPEPEPEPVDEPTESAEASDADYEVGYKKPPRHTRFKAGQSGNPRGRPKGAKGLNTIVRENLTQKVAVRTPEGEKKISRMEALFLKKIELAMKGNLKAMSALTKLYPVAVPDDKNAEEVVDEIQDLTAADLAMLEEFRRTIGVGKGEVQ